LAPDFEVSDFEAPELFAAPLRAGEREADFVAVLFDAPPFAEEPDFDAVVFDAPVLFAADLAPDLAPPAAAFVPLLVAPAPVLVAPALLPEPELFDPEAAFLLPSPDAPPELAPDLRDLVVLSAITRLLSAFA